MALFNREKNRFQEEKVGKSSKNLDTGIVGTVGGQVTLGE